MAWVHADATNKRLDEKYLISHRIQMPLGQLGHLLSQVHPAHLPLLLAPGSLHNVDSCISVYSPLLCSNMSCHFQNVAVCRAVWQQTMPSAHVSCQGSPR